MSFGKLGVNLGGEIGHASLWRHGLWKKGLFLDDSQGDSKKLNYLTYKLKANFSLNSRQRTLSRLISCICKIRRNFSPHLYHRVHVTPLLGTFRRKKYSVYLVPIISV